MPNNKKTKWLVYTVLVGIIPLLCRLLVSLVSAEEDSIELLASSDFVVFGLVLHISIINEIEHLSDFNQSWKTMQNGFSLAFVAFYGVLYALTLFNGNVIDPNKLKWCEITLSLISFLISYSVFDRISKVPD